MPDGEGGVKRAILIAFSLLLSACGPMVPVKDVYSLPAEQRRQALAIEIYNEGQMANQKYSILNIVEGVSCKNKMWDPAATKTDAINQAKFWATEQGADGIMNVQCDSHRGTTVTYNCWESVTCTAQAIKLQK